MVVLANKQLKSIWPLKSVWKENLGNEFIFTQARRYFGNYKEQKGDGIAYITNDEQQNITADMIAEFLEGTLE